MKITYPFEFLRAVIEFDVIRGSNNVIATMVDININKEVKNRVITV